jgi:hypothetical protein
MYVNVENNIIIYNGIYGKFWFCLWLLLWDKANVECPWFHYTILMHSWSKVQNIQWRDKINKGYISPTIIYFVKIWSTSKTSFNAKFWALKHSHCIHICKTMEQLTIKVTKVSHIIWHMWANSLTSWCIHEIKVSM